MAKYIVCEKGNKFWSWVIMYYNEIEGVYIPIIKCKYSQDAELILNYLKKDLPNG